MRSKQLHFLLTILSIYGLCACGGGNHRFNIIGNINGLPEQTVVLEQVGANGIITIVDSERSKPDGHFELSGIAPEPGLYRLHFHPVKYILLSLDNRNVKIDADWAHLEAYTVTGSSASEDLKNFVGSIRAKVSDFNAIGMVMDSMRAKANDSMNTIAQKEFQDMKLSFTQYLEHYADTSRYQPNAVFAVRMLNPATESYYLQAFSQSMIRRFPNTKMSRDFAEYYSKAVAAVKQRQQIPKPQTINEDTPAPEIALPDINGKATTLSSLKGKYVLVDFWASWCGPCRGENPNVVSAYERFKNKNFTVLGVSLDNDKVQWQRAVTADHLSWTQVSDLKGWKSPVAALYGVQSIPSNFLVDPTGKIIAHDLRGNALEEKLQEILKSTSPTP